MGSAGGLRSPGDIHQSIRDRHIGSGYQIAVERAQTRKEGDSHMPAKKKAAKKKATKKKK